MSGHTCVVTFILLLFTATPSTAFVFSLSPRHGNTNLPRGLGTWDIETAYQSFNIDFGDWITLFTLCLTPVAMHLIAGVPEPVILSGKPPRWLDRVGHYNPTSILWRYFAIIDRRIRARSWTAEDMAASNAHFWVGGQWESGEQVMIQSRRLCIHKPISSHIELLSSSALKTLVVALQGAHAIYYLTDPAYATKISLANILSPVALLGLLRLPAALWLSQVHPHQYLSDNLLSPESETEDSSAGKGYEEAQSIDVTAHFHLSNSARGIASRIAFLVPLLALMGYTLFSALPVMDASYKTSAAIYAHIMFFNVFVCLTVVIFIMQFVRGRSHETIIPCYDTWWYRVYSVLVFGGILVLVVLAAVSTRKSWCGEWTTMPTIDGEVGGLCPASTENAHGPVDGRFR